TQGPDKNATINMSTLLQRRATLIGSSLRQRTPDQKGAIGARLLQEGWPKLPARSSIAPLIDSVHPLADVVEVHEYFDGGAHIGKIVLIAGREPACTSSRPPPSCLPARFPGARRMRRAIRARRFA